MHNKIVKGEGTTLLLTPCVKTNISGATWYWNIVSATIRSMLKTVATPVGEPVTNRFGEADDA